MRLRHASAIVVLGATLLATPARAEKHVFIIANNADGYGVERCLVTGESCGTALATAYCQAQNFNAAVSFHRVEAGEVTASVATAAACRGAACQDLVAIECTR